jgi:hypothetical protein
MAILGPSAAGELCAAKLIDTRIAALKNIKNKNKVFFIQSS